MPRLLNQEVINDTAKLIMHRLIARQLAYNPSLIESARTSQRKMSERFQNCAFVSEWDELLTLPPSQIRSLLASRNPEMKRLRITSPFMVADGFDFTDPVLRRRIRHAAIRIAQRDADTSTGSASTA